MINEDPFRHGGYPEILLPVCRHCHHGGVLNRAIQVAVATAELLLIVIVYKQAFVVGAQPDVLPGVLEDLGDVGIGHRDGEPRIALAAKGVCQQIQFKHTVL